MPSSLMMISQFLPVGFISSDRGNTMIWYLQIKQNMHYWWCEYSSCMWMFYLSIKSSKLIRNGQPWLRMCAISRTPLYLSCSLISSLSNWVDTRSWLGLRHLLFWVIQLIRQWIYINLFCFALKALDLFEQNDLIYE